MSDALYPHPKTDFEVTESAIRCLNKAVAQVSKAKSVFTKQKRHFDVFSQQAREPCHSEHVLAKKCATNLFRRTRLDSQPNTRTKRKCCLKPQTSTVQDQKPHILRCPPHHRRRDENISDTGRAHDYKRRFDDVQDETRSLTLLGV